MLLPLWYRKPKLSFLECYGPRRIVLRIKIQGKLPHQRGLGREQRPTNQRAVGGDVCPPNFSFL
jgi:hypothetical protein